MQSTKDRGIQTDSAFGLFGGHDGRTSYIRETNYDQTLTSKVIPTTPDDYMVPSMMGTFVRTESEVSSFVPKANENRSSERRDNARNMITRYLASTNGEYSKISPSPEPDSTFKSRDPREASDVTNMIFKQSDFQEISKSPQNTKQLRQHLKTITMDTERTRAARNYASLSPQNKGGSSTEKLIIEERKTEKKEKRELK